MIVPGTHENILKGAEIIFQRRPGSLPDRNCLRFGRECPGSPFGGEDLRSEKQTDL